MTGRKQWEKDSSLQETEKRQQDQNLRRAQGDELDRDSELTAVTEKDKNPEDESLQEKLLCRVLIPLFINIASNREH